MEIKLSLVLLLVLAGIGFSLLAREPRRLLAVDGRPEGELSQLEDSFAWHHDELDVATRLSTAYLALGNPALAIGVVRQVGPELAADPILTHRLAQAYEAMGRLDDALATAGVAAARCARVVGTSEAALNVSVPRVHCTPGALIALEQHEDALTRMLRWGVDDPRIDSRARLAHELAARHAHIMSAQLE
jgi:hypothetical protein